TCATLERARTHVNSVVLGGRIVVALIGAVAMILNASEVVSTINSGQEAGIRIVLVGDSTVAEDSGWGPGFRRLAKSGVEVVNVAANGRSSKSFIDEGLWA